MMPYCRHRNRSEPGEGYCTVQEAGAGGPRHLAQARPAAAPTLIGWLTDPENAERCLAFDGRPRRMGRAMGYAIRDGPFHELSGASEPGSP